MVYHRGAEQESWFWALRFRMWQWGGYRIGEPYLTLNLNPRTALKKRFQDLLFRCSYHGFNANSHDVNAAIADMRRRRVKHLNGYASSLWLLAKAMREGGIENPGVTTVMATGDTLFPGGPGATHFDDADFDTIIRSITDKLFTFSDDTIVLPGHGNDTTIGTERPHLEEWIERGW